MPALDRFDDLCKRVADGRGEIAKTRIDLEADQTAHTAAAAKLAELPAIEARMETAQGSLATLNERLPRLTQLATARQDRDTAAQHRDQAAADAKTQQAEVDRMVKALAAFDGLDERMTEAIQVRDAAVATVQSLLRLEEAVEGVERFARDVVPARNDELAADAAEQTRLEGLVTEAGARLGTARARWTAADAARLANHLVDGEPCPVCGGTEHPSPARGW